MPDRVEVDVADLIALREWRLTEDYSDERYAAMERLVAAIPPPRLVPTQDAIRKLQGAIYNPSLSAKEMLVALHKLGWLPDDCMEEER